MSSDSYKQIARQFVEEIWGMGNLTLADTLIAPECIDHNLGPGQQSGRAGHHDLLMLVRAAFPDARFTLDDVIVEGDKVVDRWTMRATNSGSFMGIPPTQKSVILTGMDLFRMANEQIVELWHIEDKLGILQQLGIVPAPPRPEMDDAALNFPKDEPPMSTEQIKSRVRHYIEEAWNKGNLAVIDEMLAPNFIQHAPGVPPGREAVKGFFTMVHNAFPDVHCSLEDCVVEGHKVAWRLVITGTHQGVFRGIPPTGKTIRMNAINIVRVSNGLFAENWGEQENLEMMQQLGLIPTSQA